jgi:hypothetical protein
MLIQQALPEYLMSVLSKLKINPTTLFIPLRYKDSAWCVGCEGPRSGQDRSLDTRPHSMSNTGSPRHDASRRAYCTDDLQPFLFTEGSAQELSEDI